MPPASSTRPSSSATALWRKRGTAMLGPIANVPVCGLYVSVVAPSARVLKASLVGGLLSSITAAPPAITTCPIGLAARGVEECAARGLIIDPVAAKVRESGS